MNAPRSRFGAFRHVDSLLGLLLLCWVSLTLVDPAPPLGGAWWRPMDFCGAALALAILLRRSHALLRPAAAVAFLTLLWTLWHTPEVGRNPQAGQLVLAALTFGAALSGPPGTVAALQRAVLIVGGMAALVTLGFEWSGHGTWLTAWWNTDNQWAAGWRRWAGTTPHPNLFAYLCTLTLWAGMTIHYRGRRWEIPLALALGSVLGFVVFATLGRVGWVLFLATALLGAAWLLWRWRAVRSVALPGLLLAVAALSSFGGAALARPDLVSGRIASVQRQISPTPQHLLGDAESNILSRGNVYRDAMALIREAPWTGQGLAAYSRLGDYDALHTHSAPLELLLVGGVPLLLLVGGGLLAALLRSKDTFTRGLLLLAVASGVFDNFFFFKGPLVLLALSAGLALRQPVPAHLHPSWGNFVAYLHPYRQVIPIFLVLAVAFQLREEFSFDFHAYYGAVRWHDETGESPYEAWEGSVFSQGDTPIAKYMREHQTDRVPQALRFLYPPTALFQLRPFTWPDDPATAARIWRLFNLLLLGAALALLLLRVPRNTRAALATPLCLLVGSYEPLRETFWLGQVSLWIALLMAAYVWALEARRPLLGGALLAMATALKVYPAFWLLLLLMYPRQLPRAVLAFAATLVAVVLCSLATDGPALWPAYARDVLLRMGDDPPPGGITLYPYAAIVAAPWASRAVLAAVLAGCGVAAWRARAGTAPRKARVALAITAALFLSLPLVWQHYLVLIVLLLAAVVLRGQSGLWRHLPLAAAWAGGIYLLTGQMWAAEVITGFETPNYARAGLLLAVLLPWVYPLAQRLRRRQAQPRRAIASRPSLGYDSPGDTATGSKGSA